MDNDTTKDRIKDNALPRFGNVITTPTAEQYKTALKWLKEQYPSAAKISPQLFDEGNMPPHLEYMGLDIERLEAAANNYPIDLSWLARLMDYINRMDDSEIIKVKDPEEREKFNSYAYRAEMMNMTAFCENPAKEIHRFMTFILDALDAFGAEYFITVDNQPAQTSLFSQEVTHNLTASPETERRRLEVWPLYHSFSDNYISFVLLNGSLMVKQAVELYREHPEYTLKEQTPTAIKLVSGIPEMFVYPNDKVGAELWKNSIKDGKKGAFVNLAARNKAPINMFVTIDYDDIMKQYGITTEQELSVFDRRVHDAVCTLVANGREYFDVVQIWQVMNATAKNNMTEKDAEEIDNSLKYKMTRVITITPMSDYKGIRKGSKDYWGPFVLLEHIPEVIKQGIKVKDCYHVLSVPILLRFSKATGQLITGPMSMLQKTPVNKTREIQSMQDYLVRRVKSKTQSPIIVIDTMLKDGAGYEPSSYATPAAASDRRKRLIKYAKAILDKWQELGEIKGYGVTKKGRKDYSFTIRRNECNLLKPLP
jgi:hypothetical protein